MSQSSSGNQMWGGRFVTGPDEIMEEINASIEFDKILYAQDIAGSRAHAQMLVKQAIISPNDGEAILQGLDTILSEIRNGEFKFSRALEDIFIRSGIPYKVVGGTRFYERREIRDAVSWRGAGLCRRAHAHV